MPTLCKWSEVLTYPYHWKTHPHPILALYWQNKNGGRCNQNFSSNVHTVMEWSLETKFLILSIYLVSEWPISLVCDKCLSDRCCIYFEWSIYSMKIEVTICFLLIHNVSAFNYFNWHFPNWKFVNNRKKMKGISETHPIHFILHN